MSAEQRRERDRQGNEELIGDVPSYIDVPGDDAPDVPGEVPNVPNVPGDVPGSDAPPPPDEDAGDAATWPEGDDLSAEAAAYLDQLASGAEDGTGSAGASTTSTAIPEKCTDFGNARRMVANHGADIRYCYAWGKWLVWDTRRWQIDSSGAIVRRAKETVMSIYAEASRAAEETERAALAKWALRSEAAARITAMIQLAESEPGVPVAPEDLDADDWLLNCQNGILDLRTGRLWDHARRAMQTKLAPVEYDPEATCPVWDAFLFRIMDGNQELIDFLRRAVGYALTGDTREQCLFLLYGTGANGKSKFIEAIEGMLGSYARQTNFDTFLFRQNDTVRNDLARLDGVRFVTAIETERGKRLSESVVKQLTGQDTITARYLFKEYFDYKPKLKIFLACNHKPIITGNDHAIWRRIRLIPFDVTIPDEEQDDTLGDKLRAEWNGIFAWAVRGCLEWQQQGLGKPVSVQEATEEYRDEMDDLGDFFEEHCTMSNELQSPATPLYKRYLKWADDIGIRKPMSQKAFGSILREKGLKKKRSTGGKWVWKGIGLQVEQEPGSEYMEGNVYACDEYSDSFSQQEYRGKMEKTEDDNGWEGSL